MGARRHFLPRVEASRWVATQGVAKTRGSARICSGGEEEVGGVGLEWKLKASVLSRLCLNVDVCNQHIGSRPAPRFHEEGSHELTGEDVDQGADSGTRAQVVLDEQELPDWRDVDETGVWRNLGRTFNLPNLGHLSAAQREVPLETPVAPREVDRDASPSADPWEGPEETFALLNTATKVDVCPHLFAPLRREPLAYADAPVNVHASPLCPRGRLDRSPVGRKVAESSQGPKGAALELLQVALHTSSVLADERDPARGSSIPPTAWAVSSKTRNRLAHAYNMNSAGQGGESDLEKVTRKNEQVEVAMGGSTVQAEVGIYGGRSQAFLESVLPDLLKEKNRLAGASSSADWSLSHKTRNRLAHAMNGNSTAADQIVNLFEGEERDTVKGKLWNLQSENKQLPPPGETAAFYRAALGMDAKPTVDRDRLATILDKLEVQEGLRRAPGASSSHSLSKWARWPFWWHRRLPEKDL